MHIKKLGIFWITAICISMVSAVPFVCAQAGNQVLQAVPVHWPDPFLVYE